MVPDVTGLASHGVHAGCLAAMGGGKDVDMLFQRDLPRPIRPQGVFVQPLPRARFDTPIRRPILISDGFGRNWWQSSGNAAAAGKGRRHKVEALAFHRKVVMASPERPTILPGRPRPRPNRE
jgi:hypothetical protein